MPTKIFVGRLAEGTTGDEIATLFRKFGTVTECDVIANYGFVHMETEDEAKSAIAALDGYSVKGSHIHVELSTATTQGRKKRTEGGNFRGNGRATGDRFDPYPPRRDPDPGFRAGPPPGAERYAAPPVGAGASAASREEFASDQVKDLLELYFRDPQAFDTYAKTYYYGERMERTRAYYDRRPPDGGVYVPPAPRREDELPRGSGGYMRPGYPTAGADVGYAASRSGVSLRDDRAGGRVPSQTAYGGRM